MSLATTPCPSWCTSDHARHRNHGHVIGTQGSGIWVMAFQYAAEPPSVSVVNERYRPRTAHPSERVTEIQLKQVPALAALLEVLGEHQLADKIRMAAKVIEGGAR